MLVLAAAFAAWYIFTDKFADTADRQAAFTVSAVDLLKEFRQNDSLANKKYTEKIVTVNGIVSEVAMADTTANIKFTDENTGDYIIFAFQQNDLAGAKGLKEGQQASIKGSCSGGIYSEILDLNVISFKRSTINK